MARRKSFLKIIIAAGKEAERARKRAEKASAAQLRAALAAERTIEKQREREANAELKRLKKEKDNEKRTIIKQQKEKEKHIKSLKQVLTAETISHFRLGKKKPRKNSIVEDMSLDSEVRWMKDQEEELRPKYGPIKFDQILFSGMFGSVLGFDGLVKFGKAITELGLDYEDTDVTLDEVEDDVYWAAFKSGLYFVDLSKEQDIEWLTAYRYILTHSSKDGDKALDPATVISSFVVDEADLDLCSQSSRSKLTAYLEGFKDDLINRLSSFIKEKNRNRLVG